MENLKMIWQDGLIESVQYSPKLCQVTCWECESLENVFPASIARSMMQLEGLVVDDCGIKEIVGKEEGVEEAAVRFAFPQLTSMYLYSLSKLECFYPGKHTTEWPKLNVLSCGKLNILVDKDFPNLEKVTSDMNHTSIFSQSLEDLFPKLRCFEAQLGESLYFPLGILERFPKLEELKLVAASYKRIFSYEEVESHKTTLAQIKSLHLEGLHNLKEIWDRDINMGLILHKLEILGVSFCDRLINLVPPSASFGNLKVLKVRYCKGLISLLSPSTARSLLQLIDMSIKHCGNMTNVVANVEEDVEGEIIFRQLKSLTLMGLTSFTSFCSGSYTLKFPSLEKITVDDCYKLKRFSSGILSTPILQEVSQDSMIYNCRHIDLNIIIKEHNERQVFTLRYLDEGDIQLIWDAGFGESRKVFFNVKEVRLSGNDIEMIRRRQSPKHAFPRLELLQVSWDKSVTFSLGIFEIFQKVNRLGLFYGSYKKIFSFEEIDMYAGVLVQIKSLHLFGLGDLQQMWKPDFKAKLILQNLENLRVFSCRSLIHVLPPSSSFGNLKSLEVGNCERLESLVTASTTNSLVQLEEMKISGCQRMKEVVRRGRDVTTTDISFEKLKKLELRYLSSLTSFSSGNHTFNFPSLEELIVEECPNINCFSLGDLSTPILQEVWQDETMYTCDTDLNKILQQHHEKKVFDRKELNFKNIMMILQKILKHHHDELNQKVFSNLGKLSFGRDETRMIWQNQFPQHLFPELKFLEVSDDESTSFSLAILERFNSVEKLDLNYGLYEDIFSCEDIEKYAVTLAKIKRLSLYRLENLKRLWKQCGSLETVTPSSVNFQNLTELIVVGCDGLTSFLAPSIAENLVQLERMVIRDCNNLTEIIGSHTEDVAEAVEITFSNLKTLYFHGLLSLTSFCFGNYNINFPSLNELTLEKCPKMVFFTSGVLNAPTLDKIPIDHFGEEKEYIDDGDLNEAVRQIHEKLNNKSCTEDGSGPSALSHSSASSSAN